MPTHIEEPLTEVMNAVIEAAPEEALAAETEPQHEEAITRPLGPKGGRRDEWTLPVGKGKIYLLNCGDHAELWCDNAVGLALTRADKDFLEEKGFGYWPKEQTWKMDYGFDRNAAREDARRTFKALGAKLAHDNGVESPSLHY